MMTDTHQYPVRWSPYVYWRHKRHESRDVSVSGRGIRRTVPDNSNGLKIWMFGGSVVWGQGVSDAYTIPSCIAADSKFHLTNFGETGYVSTQNLLMFIKQLHKGDVILPKVVIWYDGFNDIFSAFQQAEAGLPMNEYNRKFEFNILLKNKWQLMKHWYDKKNRFPKLKPHTKEADYAVRIYLTNVDLMRTICQAKGIGFINYWHPYYADHEFMTSNQHMRSFFNHAYKRIENVLQVRTIPRDIVRPEDYTDWVHLNNTGNMLIAKYILADLRRIRGLEAERG